MRKVGRWFYIYIPSFHYLWTYSLHLSLPIPFTKLTTAKVSSSKFVAIYPYSFYETTYHQSIFPKFVARFAPFVVPLPEINWTKANPDVSGSNLAGGGRSTQWNNYGWLNLKEFNLSEEEHGPKPRALCYLLQFCQDFRIFGGPPFVSTNYHWQTWKIRSPWN